MAQAPGPALKRRVARDPRGRQPLPAPTPPPTLAMEFPTMTRKYSDEEKSQLIANLNLEVAHRTRQLRSWLLGGLENFKIHQEGHVSRIPKQIRGMTMREFGEKYSGNVQAALRGVQREKLASAGNDPALGEIDKNMRKRKWLTSQDQEASADPSEPRALKNARLESPQRKPGSSTGPGTAQRARLLSGVVKTPGKVRYCSQALRYLMCSSPRVDHCLMFRNLPVPTSRGLLSMLARVQHFNPNCLRLVNPKQIILLPVLGSLLYRRSILPCHPRHLVIQGASLRMAMSYACLEGTKVC